uniref:Uncharacterized protein n=1 Tax=Neogobius melanostomus TaxID=47308 RepID=A0A8C6UZK7_9GOBI
MASNPKLFKSTLNYFGKIIYLASNIQLICVFFSFLLGWRDHPEQPFVKRSTATSTSLRAKISNLICSATDTEGVHTLLDDLLAPNVYFRFNPTLSAEVSLDESRPGVLDVLRRDTQEYLERNQPKLARLCLVLGAERSALSKTVDWVSERAWGMKQRWV